MSEPSVALAAVVHTAIARVYRALRTLLVAAQACSDTERKKVLFNFFESARQLFVRLLVLVRWSQSAASVQTSRGLAAAIAQHRGHMAAAVDGLAAIAAQLPARRLPRYDVVAAADILGPAATYTRLPRAIAVPSVSPAPSTLMQMQQQQQSQQQQQQQQQPQQQPQPPVVLTLAQQQHLVARADVALWRRVFSCPIPQQFSSTRIGLLKHA